MCIVCIYYVCVFYVRFYMTNLIYCTYIYNINYIKKDLTGRVISTLRYMQADIGGFGGGPSQIPHCAPTYAGSKIFKLNILLLISFINNLV